MRRRLCQATLPLVIGVQIIAALWCGSPALSQGSSRQVVTLTIEAGRPVNRFRPDEALGAGVDGQERGDIDKVYTPANIAAMLSAGFKPLAYRLRTELGIEAWHWNPAGSFSDAERQAGYWCSDSTPGSPILTSNGYSLPRRGSTGDQANDRGYSRIDDGDLTTFWKSSPYLDQKYTGDDNALHPQWILVDFNRRVPVNSVRVSWGSPYARRYRVEYWQGADPADPGELPENSRWVAFEHGNIQRCTGGQDFRKLSGSPVKARWIRIMLLESAPTRDTADPRDGLGYAVRELQVGETKRNGKLIDRIKHGASRLAQTRIYVSSTDPWHRATDLDKNVEQPGFDRLFQSGLTNGLPVLMPVPLLYDTPENAAAEVRWLKQRGYPVKRIEMGEEPDGQFMLPEDYGALYLQWARAIHSVDSSVQLGGPGFQTVLSGWQCWPDAQGITSWVSRFLAYLKSHRRLRDFSFFSFEWYPFDNICDPTAPQLAAAPAMLSGLLGRLQHSGLSPEIPWVISEYGYSSSAGAAEVDMAGAILNTEIVAQFLTLGGEAAYLYGYEPVELMNETRNCISWGNLTLFQSDEHNRILRPLAAYYGARLLTQEWVEPGDGLHTLFVADSALKNAAGHPLITSYAVRRPDKTWSILLLNKDPKLAHTIQIAFQGRNSRLAASLVGPVTEIQYSSRQYVWHAKRKGGYAQPNLPPAQTVHPAEAAKRAFTLPPYSITVLRAKGTD